MPADQTLWPLILLALLSGILGLIVNIKRGKTKPKTALILMIAIPTLTLGLFTGYLVTKPLPPLEQAGLYVQNEEYDAAIALLTPLHEKDPQNADIALQLATAYFARGLLHAENKENEAALHDLETAKQTAPPDAPYIGDIERFIGIIREKENFKIIGG